MLLIFQFYFFRATPGGMQDLSSPTQPGIKPVPLAVESQSLIAWTPREVPFYLFFFFSMLMLISHSSWLDLCVCVLSLNACTQFKNQLVKTVCVCVWQTGLVCLKSEVKGRFCQQPRTSVQPWTVGFSFNSRPFPCTCVYGYVTPRLSRWLICCAVLNMLHH